MKKRRTKEKNGQKTWTNISQRNTFIYGKKKDSISLVTREMQIKPTVRYHIITIWLANIKDSQHKIHAEMWSSDTQPLPVGAWTVTNALEDRSAWPSKTCFLEQQFSYFWSQNLHKFSKITENPQKLLRTSKSYSSCGLYLSIPY